MTLETYRKKIDQIDHQIIDLLAQRFMVVKSIRDYKSIQKLPTLDLSRWADVLASVKSSAKKKWLSETFVADLRERIHKESLLLQKIKKSA